MAVRLPPAQQLIGCLPLGSGQAKLSPPSSRGQERPKTLANRFPSVLRMDKLAGDRPSPALGCLQERNDGVLQRLQVGFQVLA